MRKDLIIRLLIIGCLGVLVFQFGVKPLFQKEYYIEARKMYSWAEGKLTKEDGIYDVVVVGAEPEGISAAISAARLGAKTLLMAEDGNISTSLAKNLYLDFEVQKDSQGNVLNRGIFSELYSKLGNNFSISDYNNIINKLVDREKNNLEIVYGTKVKSVVMENSKLTALNADVSGKNEIYKGKRFIDATRNGTVLEKCKVPYTVGSQDLNMKGFFAPLKLSFIVEGVKWNDIKALTDKKNTQFYKEIQKYKPGYINAQISDFKAVNQGDGRVLILGLEIANVDVTDASAVSAAYKEAAKEAADFSAYIISRFQEFKKARLLKIADEFYIPENRHYSGEYTLTVNELLENKDFDNKIAMGSSPVEAGKFAGGKHFIVGKPEKYGIPLGTMIPAAADNILMVGSKISYSSLASSGAGNICTSIATGEAAGAVAVYSLTRGMTPREISREKDIDKRQELQKILKRQGMYLPEFKITPKNTTHWSYASVRQLNSLGLLAGGPDNDFNFDAPAKQEDMAILLLNGIYRVSQESYTLELDSRLRPYFVKDKLTRDKAAEILVKMHTGRKDIQQPFKTASEAGYIDQVMQLRLKGKQQLTMDDVYYLAAYNIKLYTKKDIKD